MALKPVTDPNLLAQLNAAPTPQSGLKPVTDPNLLAQLDAPEALPGPRAPMPLNQLGAEDVPSAADAALSQAQRPVAAEDSSLWDRVKNAQTGDPIIDMWIHGLTTAAKGAPEVALNSVNNAAVQSVAGLTAPFVSEDPNDAANYIRDFTEQNMRQPQGDSARQLTEALGVAVEPLQNIKSAAGEGVLGLTGSPDAAASTELGIDALLTGLGLKSGIPGGKVDTARRTRFDPARGGMLDEAPAAAPRQKPVMAEGDDLSGARERLPTPEGPPTPMVGALRDADIRLRPSDVRAMVPGAKKVRGEFRERFADAPDLKKDTTLHNQQRMTDLAAEEFDLPTSPEGFTPQMLEQSRAPAVADYQLVEDVLRTAKVGDDTAALVRQARELVESEMAKGEQRTLLGVLGKLRQRAARHIKSTDEVTESKGYAERKLADDLEDAIERELTKAGEPQLIERYRAARERFAKSYDVEAALRANQIDANVLYKLQQKTGKLTGRLKLIADASEFAPNVTAHSTKTAARAGDEVAGSREGLIKEFLKATMRKIPGMDVGSERFQRSMGAPNEARAASYGRPSEIPAPRDPEQGALDLREVLALDTPGSVGPRPQRRPDANQQEDFLGGPLELTPPGGRAGRDKVTVAEDLGDVIVEGEPLAEPAVNFQAQTLADVLGLSEPLVKKPRRKR